MDKREEWVTGEDGVGRHPSLHVRRTRDTRNDAYKTRIADRSRLARTRPPIHFDSQQVDSMGATHGAPRLLLHQSLGWEVQPTLPFLPPPPQN